MTCPVCSSILSMTGDKLWESVMNTAESAHPSSLYVCTNPSCESTLLNIAWTAGEEVLIMHQLGSAQPVCL